MRYTRKADFMYYPDKKEFLNLTKRGNLIPVYKEILADLETPVSAFMKIDKGDYSYLLESVEGQEKTARFSFLGSNPSLVCRIRPDGAEIQESGKKRRFEKTRKPLSVLKRILSRYKFVEIKQLPRFCGGLVGFMGYDMIRFFETIPDENEDPLGVDDAVFMLTDTILIFDHIDHKIKVVSNAYVSENAGRRQKEMVYKRAVKKIDSIVRSLKKPLKTQKNRASFKNSKIKPKSNMSKKAFKKIVEKAKEYIKKGDIIQAVLSQRLEIKLKRSKPFDLYRALRSINPSPYMFYLKLKDLKLIGSSPEILVRCEEGKVQTRPIAGTRRRGINEEEDEKMRRELLSDPKEKAEHIMLVDLGRNDIGKVCDYKSIVVPELMVIEKYSHVMHIVSDVYGTLSDDKDIFDVVGAAFPAGTVTGAPKIRAMEIIDELENTRRGPYAGCVGYFSFSGNLDTCITIRTMAVKKKKAYIQAGAGIVADSEPEKEFKETINKAQALINAIQMSEAGFGY
jgi:anthranilate synthase component 1